MSAAEQLPPDALDALTQRVAEAHRAVVRRDVGGVGVALLEAFAELERVQQTSALATQPREANAAQGGGGCGAAAPAAPSPADLDARPPARWMRRARGGSLAHAFLVEVEGAEPNRVSLCHTVLRGQRDTRNEWVRAEPGDARCRHCGRWARR